MNNVDIGKQLVALCKQGKNDECIETLYADDIVSVESFDGPGGPRTTNGKAGVLAKGKWWTDNHDVHEAGVEGPFPHGDDRFAVVFDYDITFKAAQKRFRMKEVAVYTVANGKIVKEEFFYGRG
jgi:ketosteroid isomerase-like protein